MTAAVEQADLPPFSNLRAVCARCARRVRAYVMFDRDCPRAHGDHFHRRCIVCGHEWIEACSERRTLGRGGRAVEREGRLPAQVVERRLQEHQDLGDGVEGERAQRVRETPRDRRPVPIVSPGPRLDAQRLSVWQILPAQLSRRAAGADTGARALCVRLLELACWDAGLGVTGPGRRRPKRPARTTPARRRAARRWLCGELDGEVSVPLRWCCDVLGLDAATLARIVRQRVP